MRSGYALPAIALASAAAAQVTIMVGEAASAPGGALQFSPPNVTATNGTVVTFMFTGSPGNHTVAQSSMDSPCQQIPGGFSSGFIFVPPNSTTGFPSWNLTITNDQEPVLFYCGQLQPMPHCVAGMVGAINAGAGVFESFQQAAEAATSTLPGQPQGNLVGVGASASAAPGPITGSFSAAALATAAVNVAGTNSSASTTSPTSTSSSTTSGASSSSSAPPTTTSPNSASLENASGLVVFLASLLGMTLF